MHRIIFFSFFFFFPLSGESELDSDVISQLRTINQACLNASLSLSNDCIKRIHLLEDKRSNFRKLLQIKLVYSLEYAASFAKLAFELENLAKEQEYNPMLSTVLHHSIQCIQATLHDSDIQASE